MATTYQIFQLVNPEEWPKLAMMVQMERSEETQVITPMSRVREWLGPDIIAYWNSQLESHSKDSSQSS